MVSSLTLDRVSLDFILKPTPPLIPDAYDDGDPLLLSSLALVAQRCLGEDSSHAAPAEEVPPTARIGRSWQDRVSVRRAWARTAATPRPLKRSPQPPE
jgi:hypothetical protein